MSNEELRGYYDAFTTGWKFFNKYSAAEDTDEYWNNAVKEARELGKKGKSRFLEKILLATIDELERLCNARKKIDDPDRRAYYDTYTDCWKYFKKYHDVCDSETMNAVVTPVGTALYERNKTEFRKAIIQITMDELEKLCRVRAKEG